jgi:V/A-type H+-transporting ATPase subunit D
MELTKQKKKLVSASRGHKLLKDKRDELVRQFMDLIRENMELRLKVEKELKETNMEFAIAKAGMSEQVLNTALMASKKTLEVKQEFDNVMSVEIPKFYVGDKVQGNDNYSYGYAFTAGDLDDAVYSLSEVFADMLKLAEIEKSCQLMASEIEKTRRRVNALEHVIIPQAQENIKYITMKLDENERSTQIRLMKVKDMMLEQNRANKQV